MNSIGVVVFWAVLGVATFTYGGTGLVLYCARLDRWPIRRRLPMEMLAGSVFAWLFSLSCSITNALVDYMPPFWVVYSNAIFMQLAADTFTIVAWTLWLMFSRTQGQLKIARRATDAENVAQTVRSLAITKGLLSRRARIAYVVGNAIVYTAIAVGYTLRHPDLFTSADADSFSDPTSPTTTLESIGVYKMGVSMTLVIILSIRMRIVSDALGIKRSLKRIGVCSIVGVVIYAFIAQPIRSATGNVVDVNSVVAIVVCAVLLTLSIHIPVRDSYSQQPDPVDQTMGNLGLFESFLCSSEGFETFKKHLELELALENLLFWEDVQEYRRTFTNSPRSAEMALRIYRRYLARNAPFEVNLDGDQLHRFQVIFTPDCNGGDLAQRGQLTKDLFDEARAVVLRLMYTNSFVRFRKARPDSWQNFMDGAREDAILAELETHTTGVIVEPTWAESCPVPPRPTNPL
ncbi:unnamed protein product (mitochondrion) [Plasmodiophora brassicae]|uniref:RGS domain-containing protein n=1 Tax=Plasmodiophora brassicae TaxID=37360 RepID=A0A0G4ILN8_PLABS|nr:hypothetical protein PBRA_004846 [Plasmodiophora brassicae]SPQ93300.1 unnamed protein product [Plasmodiophora brassicae]